MQSQRTYFFTFAKAGTCSPEHIALSYLIVGGKTKGKNSVIYTLLIHGENCFSLEFKKENH